MVIPTLCLILSSSLLVEGFFGKGHGNNGMEIAAILAAGLISKLLENQHHHHGCHHHHSAASHLNQRIATLRNQHVAESPSEQRIAEIYHRLAASQQLQRMYPLKRPQLQQRIPQLNHQKIANYQHQDVYESQLEQKIAAIRHRLASSHQHQRIARLQQRIVEMNSPQLEQRKVESYGRGHY